MFIQGDNAVTLAPGSGQMLTVADPIADMTGSHDASDQTGAGALVVDGAGTVTLSAADTYTGGTTIDFGTLLLAAPGAAGGGPIAFATGNSPTLELGTGDAPTNQIAGWGSGDALAFAGETITGALYTPGAGEGVLALTFSDHTTVDLDFSGNYGQHEFGVSGGEVTGVACYTAGTRITTPRGEVPIETLQIGDNVISLSSGHAPVRWIGHRRIDCHRHPAPKTVLPVRVSAGAFGDAQPARDLHLSPYHVVFVGGLLIPVRYLINGSSVVQEAASEIMYVHIELSAHSVILAEGLPAESYLDTGNRAAFESGTDTSVPCPSKLRSPAPAQW